jgi:putative ABC transport system ATP-binding protein
MKNIKKEVIIRVKDVGKTFKVGSQQVEVLKGISLEINRGDFAIILGPSGCGKSTLLHTILGMEKPTSGKVELEGNSIYDMEEDKMVSYRKTRIGVVFQQSIWIKSLNVLENVCVPSRLMGRGREESEKLAYANLKTMELEAWAKYFPSELSSGQQQRVSLARALTIDPLVIVADEPTGNLDTVSGDQLMEHLSELNKKEMKTILMVTHDLEYLRYATKLFHIVDGKLVEEYDNKGAVKLAMSLRTKKGGRTEKTVRDADFLKVSKGTYGGLAKT